MVALRDNCLVAIIGDDPAAAATLRRAGIACRTFFSGSPKKQMRGSSDVEVVVMDGEIKDMLTGAKMQFHDLLTAVEYALENGLRCAECEAMSFDDYMDRVDAGDHRCDVPLQQEGERHG